MTVINQNVPDGNLSCPLPLRHSEQIVMGHGSGGLMTHALITDIFQKYFSNQILDSGNDAAVIHMNKYLKKGHLVVSTDAHIVSPIFFSGGDIGRLAVCGTVNDVTMMGAYPQYLTASFIIEEGFTISNLKIIAASMAQACLEAGVQIIAGDTKVTQKGKSDGIFISTTGIGWVPQERNISGQRAQLGDAIIISGTLGDHGIAVLEARGELGFTSNIQSDVAPLNGMIASLLEGIPDVHVLRDPTRGGLATTLIEIAHQSHMTIQIDEETLPIQTAVQTACEMLGFDPLYIA
ncbi:MAG: hydrogenase expression/formation protein HypE, partial [Anaerolineaceae bacterium]|nr:hydrogenase expression/formation protein HypE [Anaerolineaceae bacterium]